MIKDRIEYTHTYQIGLTQWQKIRIGASIHSTEDIQKALEELEDDVHAYHRKSNPSLYPKGNEPIVSEFIPEVQVEKTKQSSSQRIIEQINQCSDKTVLESFKLLAKSNPEIQKAYDNKLGQFQV